MKNSCTSKLLNATRGCWIQPELRPNILNSFRPKQDSEIENIHQIVDKEIISPVFEYSSMMKCHHDFVILQISNKSNAEIIFPLKNYLKDVSAFLKSAVDGNHDIISKLYDITITYVQNKLRLIKAIRDKLRQDTGQYRSPEPHSELRPIASSKLCIRSQNK